MEPRGVIFDMDGVLVLTEQAHWQSWLAAAEPRGVKIEYPTFLSCFGRINPDCIRILFGPGVEPRESEQIAQEKEAAFRDIIRTHIPLAPGVVELLKALREIGVRCGVGSSGPRENVNLIVDGGGLRPLLDGVVNGSEITRGKPAPDVFLLAANRMGVLPRRCAVIEDAPSGIAAAVAARMLPVAVTTTHDERELQQSGAKLIFPSVADISAADLVAAIQRDMDAVEAT
jgi:beta-phosphoglucomutase